MKTKNVVISLPKEIYEKRWLQIEKGARSSFVAYLLANTSKEELLDFMSQSGKKITSFS